MITMLNLLFELILACEIVFPHYLQDAFHYHFGFSTASDSFVLATT